MPAYGCMLFVTNLFRGPLIIVVEYEKSWILCLFTDLYFCSSLFHENWRGHHASGKGFGTQNQPKDCFFTEILFLLVNWVGGLTFISFVIKMATRNE